MSPNRRDFIKLTTAAGGALGLGFADEALAEPVETPSPSEAPPQEGRALRILILGGTGFIGPPMVQYALDRGHEVTLFNRGSSLDMFPGVETLIGDRNDDVSSLAAPQSEPYAASGFLVEGQHRRGSIARWVLL